VVAIVSAGAIRRRVSYETWYYLHLATYVALYLAFWHQIALGSEFLGDDVARAGWYGLYIGVAALVVWYRILAPIRLNLRHRLRVETVVPEASGVVSILIGGRRLRALRAEPGQFFRWRFLTRGLRWSANPYSLSAFPRADVLRITVKATGDHSAALRALRPGTRVWAEGPFGALTAARRSSPKVLLIAGGVGITPLRTLFEVLPAREGDLTLMYWARREEDLVLREELTTIALARKARLLFAVTQAEGGQAVPLDSDTLRRTVPDIAEHDVYLCGPPGMTDAAWQALRDVGVPKRRIHHETFEL
jgi:ferredoxin-NADP reductase